MDFSWGYDESNGPLQWSKYYLLASGTKQSPINIDSSVAQTAKFTTLTCNYNPDDLGSLLNTGHGWKVDIHDSKCRLSGGPLADDIYKLQQFHCHWGSSDDEGSEHTVDGVPYSGELHLVHWNTSKYDNFHEAASASNGLAVLAIFFKIGEKHSELTKITDCLHLIKYKGDRLTLPAAIDLSKCLPERPAYWTYDGSLTTPPCAESVTWIVFKTPTEISNEQLSLMRSLRCFDVADETIIDESHSGGLLRHNHRPTLPLGERVLQQCDT